MTTKISQALIASNRSASYRILGYLLLAIVLLAAPLALQDSPYLLHTAILAWIFVALASSFNLLWGFTGLLSLGHTALFGIGAYVTAILTAHHANFPVWIEFPAAGIVAGFVAFLVGIPALRMAKTSFVMVTLAFLVVAQVINSNWMSMTNGAMGISNIPPFWITLPGIPDIYLETRTSNYYASLLYAGFVVIFIARLVKSRFGKALIAIREDEILAQSYGVSTFKYKLIAFILAGVLAGLTGSVYAHYVRFVGPSVFDFPFLSKLLIIVIAGGAGSVGGVAVGGVVFTIVPELLRMTNEYREIMYGVIVILFVIYMPSGLAGMWSNIKTMLRRKRL